MKIDMAIPKGYKIAKIDSSNAWIRKETAANSMNILIYIRPYKSTVDFEPANIIARRNGLTRTYIPGPTAGKLSAYFGAIHSSCFQRVIIQRKICC
jgi:hypothetical protein